MGIEIPGELQWVAQYLLGAGDWPDGDETAMRRVADGWTAMANTLNTVDDHAAVALNAALTAISEGETHTAIATFRDKFLAGDQATVTAVRTWCEKQAELLDDGANDIEHTKLVIIGTMIVTAAELAVALATSWTGVGAVAGVAARVAGQIAIRIAIKQLIARMLSRGAAKAAARLALRGAAFEALEEGGVDLAARMIQVSNGDRTSDKFGWTDLGLATFGGAVGGAVGGVLGGGTGALADTAGSTVGKVTGKIVGGAVTELGADVSAQVAAAGVGAAFLGREFNLDIGVETFTSAGAGGVQSAIESGGSSPAQAPTVPELGTEVPGATAPAAAAPAVGDSTAPASAGDTTPASTSDPASTTPASTGEPVATAPASNPDSAATAPASADSPTAADVGDSGHPAPNTTAEPGSGTATDAGDQGAHNNSSPLDAGNTESAPDSTPDTAPENPSPTDLSSVDDSGPNQTAPQTDTSPVTPNNDQPDTSEPSTDNPATPDNGLDQPTTDAPPAAAGPSSPTSPDTLTATPPLDLPAQTSLPTETSAPTQPDTPATTTPLSPQPNSGPATLSTSAVTTPAQAATDTGTRPAAADTATAPTTLAPSTTQPTSNPIPAPTTPATNVTPPTVTPAATPQPSTPPVAAAQGRNGNAPTPATTSPTTATPATNAPPVETPPQAPSTRAPSHEMGTTPTPPPTPNTNPFGPNPTPTTTNPAPPSNPAVHNQARSLRESLRNLPSQDGRTTAVDANRSPFLQRPPAYRIRRFHLGGNQWVAVATIRAHIPNAHLMSPAELNQAMERIQATVDPTFNNGSRLLGSGDRLLVDVEFTTDPTTADTILDPSQPTNTTANALREHMGLFPAQPDSQLSPDDLREISNDVARANTPARFGDPANTRVVDHRRLDDVEDPDFQTAVEDSLRSGNSFVRSADPRTHPYGESVNDGGRSVPGRSNNCVDCSISALSSFFGIPRVSAPRWPDQLPNGQRDNASGEWGGRERASAWLGADWGSYSGMSLPDQYQALHNYIASLGPGSAAMVGTMWHARDVNGNKLYNADGTPVFRGGHATVVVFPLGATGPVWWDPQSGETFDAPPPSLTNNAASMECIPIDANGGPVSGGTSTHPGTGQTIAGPSVRAEPGVQHPGEPSRLGVPADAVPGGASPVGNGPGQLRDQQTYGSDHGALKHGDAGDRGGVRHDDGSRPAAPGLPGPSGTTPDRTHQDLRGPEHDHLPDSPDLSGQTDRTGDHPGSRDHQESDPASPDGPHLGGRDIVGIDAEQEHGDLADGGDVRGVTGSSVTSSPEGEAPGHTTHAAAKQVGHAAVPIPGDPSNGGTPAHPTDVTSPSPTPSAVTPTPQQIHHAHQSRAARESLRNQQPDGGVQPVTDDSGSRRFTWGRYTAALGSPVSVLRIGVSVAGAAGLDPAAVAALLERAQLAVDLHCNSGTQLLSGDWMMVDLVPVTDPSGADIIFDLDPSTPGHVDLGAEIDVLTAQIRQQLGLADTGDALDDNDVRELSNNIARANTPAHLDGLPDTRVEGANLLDAIEQVQYQHDVEDALRDGNSFVVGADPRTNDYGELINDGGPSQRGRSNNCLDGSLAALSSFFGRPEVGAPRWPDLMPDGSLDTRSGEVDGPARAAAWLGGAWQYDASLPIAEQFQALHDQIANMGPGSAALVINSWHAFDQNTGQFQYNADGTPQVEGAHATVVVFPHGAAGPVWWDPQQSTFSDSPPADLTGASVELWSMPVGPQGAANAGPTATHHGTSAGLPGGSLSDTNLHTDGVPARVGVPTTSESERDRSGPGLGPDQLRGEQTDRGGDGTREPAPHDDRREVRSGDRREQVDPRTPDLPATAPSDISPYEREPDHGHIPGHRDVAGEHGGTPAVLPPDLRQTDPETRPARPDGLTGDLEGEVAQQSRPELAGSRDDRGLADPDARNRDAAGGTARPQRGRTHPSLPPGDLPSPDDTTAVGTPPEIPPADDTPTQPLPIAAATALPPHLQSFFDLASTSHENRV
ncbi:toxin glutamine deamidase domain-containing protein [Nocardia neocaledoniensis]|uniref:toxin glutamine deamidase domain-containing protein n=1 Tax=Nocardia neocaledoniensis TaxID=236511 RepID=UPI002456923F|nr:toxin glutamine deamidase domain-containing protein [Nocardia neocaledoniensis]